MQRPGRRRSPYPGTLAARAERKPIKVLIDPRWVGDRKFKGDLAVRWWTFYLTVPSGKEGQMLILAVHQVPSLTQEKYEQVVRKLTNGKSRLESASDLPFEGLLMHAAGQGKNGFCIMDVFESEEAVEKFREVVTPIAQEVGIEEPPDFFQADTFFSVGRRTL